MLVLVLILGALFSVLTPPMKSPDEAGHVMRAYFLSQGRWGLKTEACSEEGYWCRHGSSMSGGDLDKGLYEYLNAYDTARHQKENSLDDVLASGIRWHGEKVFSPAAGTGFYFPLIYTPQALALGVGELFGLSVSKSYYLARAAVVMAGALILILAFSIYLPSPAVWLLLALPMSIFQAASASIDFLSTALAMLAICCFVRASGRVGVVNRKLLWLMAASIFVVATCRPHLAAMVFLLFTVAWQSKRRWVWGLASGTALLVLLWTVAAISGTVDFRTGREAGSAQVALFYFNNPGELFRVLNRTLANDGLVGYYVKSFIGVFADHAFPGSRYVWLGGFLVLSTVLSISPLVAWRSMVWVRLVLLTAGMATAALAFIAMLVAWSPFPANIIEGVQGRYLLVPVILVLVGLSAGWSFSGPRGLVCKGVALLAGVYGVLVSAQGIMSFFYVPLVPAVVIPVGESAMPGLLPSPVLSPGQPLIMPLPEQNAHGHQPMRWIGMMTATYARRLRGQMAIILTDDEGKQVQAPPVDLSRARDNLYLYAPVPAGRWNRVELRVLSGDGGLSIWMPQGVDGQGPLGTGCLVVVEENNSLVYTRGCPLPG